MHSNTLYLGVLALAAEATAIGVWTTPHDKYSSSVGVLGCKINTDRVAYWPGSIGCDNICVRLSYGGRSVNLLRIDQSGGAHDISYDAWAYLQTGQPASANPISGGGVAMEYEEVPASECASLINTPGNKLPLSASNSINYLSSCLAQPSSWVAQNHVLYNICDAICSVGFDEECHLDMAVSNQPSCPHTLGLTAPLTTLPVYDVEYQTGRTLIAGSGQLAPAQNKAPASESTGAAPVNAPEAPEKPSGGVFVEYSTAAAPTEAPVTYPTTVVAPPPAQTTPEVVPYPTSEAPSYSEVAPTYIATGTTPAPVYTMSTVVVAPSQTKGSTPSKPVTVPVNAGAAAGPAAALVSAMLLFSIIGTFI